MMAGRLGAYAAKLRAGTLPGEVVHATKCCLIDWFAAALPGAPCPPATLLIEALDEELANAHSGAELLPGGRQAPARAAALINGTAAHTVEFDDIYRDALYHPGAPVIAAALALAQRENLNGTAFIAAIVSGYEISNRIGEALVPSHYDYWHTTGTVGTLGAAAAAATALGLDAEVGRYAIGNSASFAAGLQQAFRSDAMTKPMHAGRAAETGVLCALAAAKGVTAARDMLEGPRGLAAAMSKDTTLEGIADDLGERYTITRTTQKNHGCCGHSFAALDGIVALRAKHGFNDTDIEQIEIGTYAKAVEIVGNPEPATPYEAKFSLPYCAAAAAIDGKVRLASFDPQRLKDPALRDLMSRVSLSVTKACEEAFPGRRSAVVTLVLRDGASWNITQRPARAIRRTRSTGPSWKTSSWNWQPRYWATDASQRLLATLWTIDERPSMRGLLGELSEVTPVRAHVRAAARAR